MLSYEIIYLIYLYIRNLKPRIIFGNKIFYKNVQIHISSKVNILYKLSTCESFYQRELERGQCVTLLLATRRRSGEGQSLDNSNNEDQRLISCTGGVCANDQFTCRVETSFKTSWECNM